jgi:hypothetical protein
MGVVSVALLLVFLHYISSVSPYNVYATARRDILAYNPPPQHTR